jgi:hypothetical protein
LSYYTRDEIVGVSSKIVSKAENKTNITAYSLQALLKIQIRSNFMESIKLRSHVGKDGILHLDIPVNMEETELEVTVTFQAIRLQII